LKEKKANLFIIGASKCGTTSLWNMLNLHPEVFMTNPKEPFFFSFSDYFSKIEGYQALFKNAKTETYLGEATPIYSETTLIPELPERLFNYNPQAKIIYLVRNPLERLKSVWRQLLYTGHDLRVVYNDYCDAKVPLMPKKFEEALFIHPNFVEATKYWTHLNNYLNVFPKKNVGVFYFEDLKNNPEQFFTSICEFLEIETYFDDAMLEVKNSSIGRTRDYYLISEIKKIKPLQQLASVIKKQTNLSQSFLKKEIKYTIEISEKDRNSVLQILKPEIDSILSYSNKPNDFWNQ
jgi:hypothetical protein